MAVDMFLKIGDIQGEALDASHKNEIDVLAWSWGLSQSGTMHLGSGGSAGKVSIQDVSVTKYVDKATPNLIKACCNGKQYPNAILVVRKAGGDTTVEYVKITMEPVIITSVSSGGSQGEERLTESVQLNFGKVKYEYTLQNPDGSAGASVPVTHNIQTNETT
jgi:type VI secretion system secreted protein Hcp